MASASLNNTTYWIIGGVIVLAVVGFGGYKLWHHYSKGSTMQYSNTNLSSITKNQPTIPNQNIQTGINKNNGLPNKTDTSNQQLDQDAQNIQNSLNQLQQDQGMVNNDSNNQSQDVPQQ